MPKSIARPIQKKEWVGRPEAARMLGVPKRAITRLAAKGFLTSRFVPGAHPQFLVTDLKRIEQSAIRPATVIGSVQ